MKSNALLTKIKKFYNSDTLSFFAYYSELFNFVIHYWFNYREFMGLLNSSIPFCPNFTTFCCCNIVSCFAEFWLWFGMERSYYSRMVGLARSCCTVTFTIG